MFASNPGHTRSRLRRKDEAASKDACHAPTALEREAGFVTVVVFFTFLRDSSQSRWQLLAAFPRSSAPPLCEHAAPPGSKLPTSPSTRTLQPIVILPFSAQYRCSWLHGRNSWHCSSIAVLSQATPRCVSPRNCRGSVWASNGPPPTFSLLARCGGIVGVSFWGIVFVASFFWKAALFDNCLTSALRSFREALERVKRSPAVCLRPKKGDLPNSKRARQRDILRIHSCRLGFRLWLLHPPALALSSFFRSFFTRRASSLKDHAQMHAFFKRARSISSSIAQASLTKRRTAVTPLLNFLD